MTGWDEVGVKRGYGFLEEGLVVSTPHAKIGAHLDMSAISTVMSITAHLQVQGYRHAAVYQDARFGGAQVGRKSCELHLTKPSSARMSLRRVFNTLVDSSTLASSSYLHASDKNSAPLTYSLFASSPFNGRLLGGTASETVYLGGTVEMRGDD